jgi:AbrB family looped-hinge helix DNA binding protein
METTIDAGGRIVVPKPLRDRLGLCPGARVRIDEADGLLTIAPVGPAVRLEDRGGVLVAVSDSEPDPRLDAAATREVLEAVRERRA